MPLTASSGQEVLSAEIMEKGQASMTPKPPPRRLKFLPFGMIWPAGGSRKALQ